MGNYKMFYEKLCCAPLQDCKIEPGLNEDTEIFIITENLCEEIFMRKLSEKFVCSGCKHISIYGKHSFEWELAIDEADIKIVGDSDDIVLTSTIENFTDFIDELYEEIKYSSERTLLFYDDYELYKELRKKLEFMEGESQ